MYRLLQQVMDSLPGQMQGGNASHLKMLMVTKYVKVGSKGVLRTKRDTEKRQFYRDFIENIRQDIAASVNRQYC